MTNSTIDILVLSDDTADEPVIRALLSAHGELHVVAYLAGLGHHVPTADVVVVACGHYTDTAGALIREAVDDNPARPVVLITQGAPNGYIDHAFEAGAADLVVLPQPCDVELARALSHQVRFTLGKAVSKGAATSADGRDGKMIVTLGPKGGSGKTLTSTNLAVALAQAGRSVTIVDLDLQFGDVGLALGLAPDTTVYDLVRSGGSLDAEKVAAFLASHDSGVRALLAPRRPDEAGLVTVDFLREVYGLLRSFNDFVIVDTPPLFSPEVIAAIDSSTNVCTVGMLDTLSLKNTRLGLETLELMGYPAHDVRFVLNRADSQVGITIEDVHAIIGRAPDVLVPSDRAITRSVNEGEPIAMSGKRSEAGRAFHELARLYGGEVPQETTKRRRRLAFARAGG